MHTKILNTYQSNPYLKTLKFVGNLTKEFVVTQSDVIRAKHIKEEIVRMGPTYIKIGQLISTRTDIFPSYITETFSELQSNIDYMDFKQVNSIFKNDFLTDIKDAFETFSETPIAAASIGQVHIATLKSNPTQKLAIKVIRKDIDSTFRSELKAIINVTRFVQLATRLSNNSQNFNDIMSILQQQYDNIDAETNMLQERKNMLVFQRLMSKQSENIVVPRVCKFFYSKNVLTMEYVPSNKVTLPNSIDKLALSNELMRTFVLMVINEGYLHCDPHPGNIGITKQGKIVLYDFGLVKKFDLNIKEYFKKVFLALVNRSSTDMIDFMLSSKIIIAKESKATSIDMLTGHEIIIIQRIIQYIYTYLNNLDVFEFINLIENDKYIDATNIPFDFDVQLVYIFKSFSTLEGVCKQINAKFNYIDLISELVFDLFDIDMLLDKAAYDIKSSASSPSNLMIKSSGPQKSSFDDYTKFGFEQLNKRFDNQLRIMLIIVTCVILVDLGMFLL